MRTARCAMPSQCGVATCRIFTVAKVLSMLVDYKRSGNRISCSPLNNLSDMRIFVYCITTMFKTVKSSSENYRWCHLYFLFYHISVIVRFLLYILLFYFTHFTSHYVFSIAFIYMPYRSFCISSYVLHFSFDSYVVTNVTVNTVRHLSLAV